MRIRIDKWLVVLAVIGLSTLSWWMPGEQGPITNLVSEPESRHVPDFYLTDFDLTTMNAAGRPRYYLQAKWMQHYVDDDTSQLLMPVLTVYRPGQPSWRVSAKRADVTTGGESLLLQDDVKMRRMAAEKRDALEVDTSVLKVIPAKQYAETDQPVTITADLGVTQAIGMRADLKQRYFQLLHQVRGVYADR